MPGPSRSAGGSSQRKASIVTGWQRNRRLQIREAVSGVGSEVGQAVEITISVCGRIFRFFVHQLRWIVDVIEAKQMPKFMLDDRNLRAGVRVRFGLKR